MSADPEIRHDSEAHRLALTVDGHACELTYRLHGTTMTIDHTGVPAAVGGRGIAGRLVAAAFALARARGWRVVPACSYAAAWAQRHPELATDLLA